MRRTAYCAKTKHMTVIRNFKELDIWKRGVELVKEVYSVTERFPDDELYGLTSQMRRSAISIPSNIAEGFRRKHTKEFKHFLRVSLGSLAELETQIVIAKELFYIEGNVEKDMLELVDHINRMIANLRKKLN